jgi:hypothetical protein
LDLGAAKVSSEPILSLVRVQRIPALSSSPVLMMSFLTPFFERSANDLER